MAPQRSAAQLRVDAQAIWQAGVAAVASDRLVQQAVCVKQGTLRVVDECLPLHEVRRIVVVGAGKAGAGMAAGLEAALGAEVLEDKQVTGWVHVPADCVRQLRRITLHAARPPGVNEPTVEGEIGCRRMLDLVESLAPDDLCLCLLSGGGSALLPAPVAGISLNDKRAVTSFLSRAGANIRQLNTVRKQLSRIKGGGLLRACRAGRLITLIISDVLGDPLDVIASGPTVPDPTTAADALEILRQFGAEAAGIAPAVFDVLRAHAGTRSLAVAPSACQLANHVIGNITLAVDAAGQEAARRGYSHALVAARELEGEANDVGLHLATVARRMQSQRGPDCLISGGEPTVTLCTTRPPGRGGRNQQVALAALCAWLAESSAGPRSGALDGLLVLSGGTDGEDGPTDAAGAIADADVAAAALRQRLDPADHLARNDAYPFFAATGGLLQTGPTHTNVCDLRVVLVARRELAGVT
ncbi:MAG: DUF4147 domain-containing protein [Pirellulaceae bacterium]|jgi:hydroxypyruvate reductase|nr:DUF4147 domain-containing protein [Pirellulaceae bacterium]